MTGLEVNNSQTHQSSTEQSDNKSIYMTRLLNPLWLQVRRHQVKSSVWIWVFFYNKRINATTTDQQRRAEDYMLEEMMRGFQGSEGGQILSYCTFDFSSRHLNTNI